jgi:hypothetical protein
MDVNSVAKVVVNAEEVVLVTSRSASAESKSDGADGRSPYKPASEVNLVDEVTQKCPLATKAIPVFPCSDKVVGCLRVNRFDRTFMTSTVPDPTGIKFAQSAFNGNGLMCEDAIPMMPKLRADNNCQPLPLGFLRCGEGSAATRRVNGDGLFNENVLARFNSSLNENGMESVSNCYHDNIGISVKDFLVSRWTSEAAFGWHTILLCGG